MILLEDTFSYKIQDLSQVPTHCIRFCFCFKLNMNAICRLVDSDDTRAIIIEVYSVHCLLTAFSNFLLDIERSDCCAFVFISFIVKVTLNFARS